MDKGELKEAVCAAIDERAREIIELGAYILERPELGFREDKAAERIQIEFQKLGLRYESGLAVTGVKARLAGRLPRPAIAVLGELDALACPGHPRADRRTGAAHVCGHNAQLATMMGVGMGLVGAGAMPHLGGSVALVAVPAEECVEIDFRRNLCREGKIQLLVGKAEMIRLGIFDEIDIAMMTHSASMTPGRKFIVGGTTNGCLVKDIRFRGRAAHAGSRPDMGVNALNAAALAIMGIHSLRETFREGDTVRVHFILTNGGEMVNVVPDEARLEMFVRGGTLEAVLDASRKVDRALRGAALAIGTEVDIVSLPGYLPLRHEVVVNACLKENAISMLGVENVEDGGHRTASTDMGDLSHLMPAAHPYSGGFDGDNHSSSFRITDEVMAYIIPAKIMAMTVVDLLFGDAELAMEAIRVHGPRLPREEYLALLDTIASGVVPAV